MNEDNSKETSLAPTGSTNKRGEERIDPPQGLIGVEGVRQIVDFWQGLHREMQKEAESSPKLIPPFISLPAVIYHQFFLWLNSQVSWLPPEEVPKLKMPSIQRSFGLMPFRTPLTDEKKQEMWKSKYASSGFHRELICEKFPEFENESKPEYRSYSDSLPDGKIGIYGVQRIIEFWQYIDEKIQKAQISSPLQIVAINLSDFLEFYFFQFLVKCVKELPEATKPITVSEEPTSKTAADLVTRTLDHLTEAEIKALTVGEFLDAIPNTRDIETLCRLDGFINSTLRTAVQHQIKMELYGEAPSGTVTISPVKDRNSYYLRATLGGQRPKRIRDLTAEEKEVFIRQEAEQPFAKRIRRNSSNGVQRES
jgi:hypothetical protein